MHLTFDVFYLFSDTQLPMFCHLIELCVAIFYGTLDRPENSDKASSVDPPTTTGKFYYNILKYQSL